MTADSLLLFFPRLKRRIINEYKRIWPYLDMDKISMRGYEPFQSTWEFKKRIEKLLGYYSPSLLDGICDSERANIIEAADQTLRHEFDLLGSGIVKSNPIDWQADLKSGEKWNKTFFRKIGHIPGADIKMPWELGRCQHLLWLGEAYLLTGEKKYPQEIKQLRLNRICHLSILQIFQSIP